jgi:hypothetical protein
MKLIIFRAIDHLQSNNSQNQVNTEVDKKVIEQLEEIFQLCIKSHKCIIFSEMSHIIYIILLLNSYQKPFDKKFIDTLFWQDNKINNFIKQLLQTANDETYIAILQNCFDRFSKFAPYNTCLSDNFKIDVLNMYYQRQKIEFNHHEQNYLYRQFGFCLETQQENKASDYKHIFITINCDVLNNTSKTLDNTSQLPQEINKSKHQEELCEKDQKILEDLFNARQEYSCPNVLACIEQLLLMTNSKIQDINQFFQPRNNVVHECLINLLKFDNSNNNDKPKDFAILEFCFAKLTAVCHEGTNLNQDFKDDVLRMYHQNKNISFQNNALNFQNNALNYVYYQFDSYHTTKKDLYIRQQEMQLEKFEERTEISPKQSGTQTEISQKQSGTQTEILKEQFESEGTPLINNTEQITD